MSDESSEPPARTPNGQFSKGVSGNRRGRPRKVERAYTNSQVRHDVLGLMEKEIEIKIMGKPERMPIILAVYWRMLLSAVEGNERMMLAVAGLRNELMQEHRDANLDLIRMVEDVEMTSARNGQVLDDATLTIFNQLRRRTRGSSS